MTALLTLLAGKASTYLIGAGAILVAFVATYARAYLNGRKAERQKQAAKERDSYAQSIKDVEAAAYAGRSVRPDDGGMLNDPNNRDNAR